ncbi:hypothetical protein DFJ74DRAFT_775501 [Hyaloraphidium curvatum]|nr:hypothetical protein DFJ74DRAFT_775501 [Hyaloraphidium curvatum]
MGSESAWSKEYRANLPAPKLKPTEAELAKYNTEFFGILGDLTKIPFFMDKGPNGRRAEGKRFPALTPAEDDSLAEDQKELANALGDRVLRVGPSNPWHRTPGMNKVMVDMLQFFNLKSEVPPMAKEIGILVTARFFNSDFEWYAHELPAIHAGLSKEGCDAIRKNLPPPVAAMTADQNAIYAFCRQLYHSERKRVDQATWLKVRELLGERGAVELMGVMSYYTWVSMCLNVDEFPIPPDTEYRL